MHLQSITVYLCSDRFTPAYGGIIVAKLFASRVLRLALRFASYVDIWKHICVEICKCVLRFVCAYANPYTRLANT